MRPRGITFLAILEILLGIFALFGGVLHIVLGQGGFVVSRGGDASLGAVANVFGNSLIIQGLLLLLAGYGISTGKSWAWSGTLLFNILGLITSAAAIVLGTLGSLPALIANVVAIYYLTRHGVKVYFRKSFGTT